jgi:putative oxidoreductase
MNATRYFSFRRPSIDRPPVRDEWPRLARRIRSDNGMIGAVGLPAPLLAFVVAVAVELGGGLLLIAGFRARLVAIALALFALATEPVQRHLQSFRAGPV